MSGNPELGEFLESVYLSARVDLAAGSVEQLQVAVRLFGRWLRRPATIGDLSKESMLAFMRSLIELGRSPATVNSRRRALLSIWTAAADADFCCLPPKIPKLREERRIPEAWSPPEVARILDECRRTEGEIAGIPRSLWWPSIVLTSFDSAGRIGAILAARPVDVELGGGYILLRASAQKTRQEELRPLHPQTVEACQWIWSADRKRMWPWPFRREALYEAFKRICRRAKVRVGRPAGGVFHKLRRTSGSLIEANGGDGARHLGNSRAVFERHYLDPRIVGRGQLDKLPRPIR